MGSTILRELNNGFMTLTLNRPEKLNCINWAMLDALDESLSQLEKEPVRLVCLRGAGDRAFSTGGDLNEFRNLDAQSTSRWIRRGQQIFDRLERLPCLSLALIEGYALGGGLELALACDLRVAAPSAVFSCPEIRHGWLPGWGALKRLSRLVGVAKAKELAFLGERVDADGAHAIGLINQVLEADKFFDFAEQLAENLDHVGWELISFAKDTISECSTESGSASLSADVLATLIARTGSEK